MKRVLASMSIAVMMVVCLGTTAMATESGPSLDDVLKNNASSSSQSQSQGGSSSSTADKGSSSETASSKDTRGQDYINNLKDSADLSGEVEGVADATGWMQTIASFIVQVIFYGITVLLPVRVALDCAFIGLPFTRKALSNGHMGNAQAGAGGMANSPGAMGGMGGMGMGGMGGMMGGGMGGGMYGRGGMGGMGMGGMGMNNMAGAGMGMATTQNNQMQQGLNIQWVSNAALNAVAGETTLGPDGKPASAFGAYWKDMVFVLILIPVLTTLAVTGALSQLGFYAGELIANGIRGISSGV